MTTMLAARKATIHGRPWTDRGVSLAHGTELRITHLGRVFNGRIDDGQWCVVNADGVEHCVDSPSKAAGIVCRTEAGEPVSMNGWLHWEVKIAGSRMWVVLDEFRPSSHR